MLAPASICLPGCGNPVGEPQIQPLELSFNSSLGVDFQRLRVTSSGNLVLVRELDSLPGLRRLIEVVMWFYDERGTAEQGIKES